MRIGVIGIPPHEFQQQSRWYYGVHGVKNDEFVVVTYGTTSIQNFINFHRAILPL
jgi:hypothetical protein